MKVFRLPHAGAIIEANGMRVLMDPIFTDLIDCGVNRLDLKIQVQKRKLKKEHFDLIAVSHHHTDHFCVDSLNLLCRSASILLPYGDGFLSSAVSRLGFTKIHHLRKFETFRLGGLEITATPSKAPFPEIGFLFAANNQVFWNPVDSSLDDGMIRSVKRRHRKIDLLFAAFQPLIERGLSQDSLGAPFPIEKYARLVRNVQLAEPSLVVPSAFGFRSARQDWINQRQFPMTVKRFLDDVHGVMPRVRVASLEPGDAIDLGAPSKVQRSALNFLKMSPSRADRLTAVKAVEWRPDKGIPPLREPIKSKIQDIRIAIRYLDEQFPSILRSPGAHRHLIPVQKAGTYWCVELVAGDKTIWRRVMEFTEKGPTKWRTPEAGEFFHLHTSVTVEAICGLLSGRLNGYAVEMGGMIRIFRRAYFIEQRKIKGFSLNGCPLGNILFRFSEERLTIYRLKQIEIQNLRA